MESIFFYNLIKFLICFILILIFVLSHEYDIFQKVVRVDYKIPDDFDQEARNLIGRWLITDPNQRLGASEAQGYPLLKEHAFFETINWQNLCEQTPNE